MKQNKNKKYLVNQKDNDSKIIKTELILTPILVIIPFLVGFFLIYDWYTRDYILNELDLFGELVLGIVIIFVNILFDISFIKSLRKYSKVTKKR